MSLKDSFFKISFSILLISSSTVLAQNSGITSSPVSFDSKSAIVPECQSADSDPDGDGWGWENMRSCHVGGSFVRETAHPTCNSASSDPDGDGWGWENNESCKVDSLESETSNTTNQEATETTEITSNTQSNTLKTNFINAVSADSSSVKIEFELVNPGPAFIDFGFSTDNLEFTGPIESNSLKFHVQRIKNLQAGETYYYQINSGGETTKVLSFNVQGSSKNFTDEPDIAQATTTSSGNNSNNIITQGEPFSSLSKTNFAAWNSGNHVKGRRKPAYRVWEKGDVPGTEIMRVSDKSRDGLHYYPSRQAWNADMTKLILGCCGASTRLLDATNNYKTLPGTVPLSYDRVWSHSNPNIIYGLTGSRLQFVSYNVNTQKTTVLYSHSGSRLFMRAKGNLPEDDSKVVFYEQSTNKFISYDIKNRRILGQLVWPHGNINSGGGYHTFDWSGDWITVFMGNDPTGRRRIFRLNPDLSGLREVDVQGAHSDCAYNSDGESVRVTSKGYGSLRITNYDNPSKNYFSPAFLDSDPTIKGYQPTPTYISGQGSIGAPGWVAVGGDRGEGSPNYPLALYHIDGNTNQATIKVIGWDHHSGVIATTDGLSDDKQKPVMSPDGNMVIFTSDWGVARGELSSYIIRYTGR